MCNIKRYSYSPIPFYDTSEGLIQPLLRRHAFIFQFHSLFKSFSFTNLTSFFLLQFWNGSCISSAWFRVTWKKIQLRKFMTLWHHQYGRHIHAMIQAQTKNIKEAQNMHENRVIQSFAVFEFQGFACMQYCSIVYGL